MIYNLIFYIFYSAVEKNKNSIPRVAGTQIVLMYAINHYFCLTSIFNYYIFHKKTLPSALLFFGNSLFDGILTLLIAFFIIFFIYNKNRIIKIKVKYDGLKLFSFRNIVLLLLWFFIPILIGGIMTNLRVNGKCFW